MKNFVFNKKDFKMRTEFNGEASEGHKIWGVI